MSQSRLDLAGTCARLLHRLRKGVARRIDVAPEVLFAHVFYSLDAQGLPVTLPCPPALRQAHPYWALIARGTYLEGRAIPTGEPDQERSRDRDGECVSRLLIAFAVLKGQYDLCTLERDVLQLQGSHL